MVSSSVIYKWFRDECSEFNDHELYACKEGIQRLYNILIKICDWCQEDEMKDQFQKLLDKFMELIQVIAQVIEE